MEYWEFLLQQEGDQNWLPLDTAQVEILEGRYRIMAHTSQAHAPVQIQISQQSLDQVPPKRRALKRQGQTNADGLMVVIPFTLLAAGTWDIYCSSQEPASEPAATAPDWTYAIQLQVMAQGSGDDEWFVDEGQMAAEDSAYSDAEYPQPDLGMASPWTDLDLAQVGEAMNRAQSHLATGGTQAALYRVTLYQTALSGHEGESLGLQGQVTGVVEGESCSDMALLVRLSDPQTAEPVAMQPFSLPASTLPASFNLALNIPDSLSTRLLLGEVGLVLVSAGTVSLLALQRFTVTVNLASLFDAIANQAESETAFNLDFSSAEGTDEPTDGDSEDHPSDPNAWANVSLPQGPPRVVPGLMLPRSGFTLPPKIYYPSPHEASAHRPTLPPLGSTKGRTAPAKGKEATATTEPTVTVPEGSTGVEASPSTAAPRESAVPPASNRPSLSLPPLTTPSTGEATDNEAIDSANLPAPALAGAGPAPAKAGVPLSPSHGAAGFRELKVGERFWTRLNDLALTIQQEVQQRRAEAASAPVTPGENSSPAPVASPSAPIPFAGEVVIYEDEDETLGRSLQASDLRLPASTEEVAEIIAPPVPLLDLPAGELTAGESVLLTVRVPFHPNRLYVKVWITDPQTRSLVDEPRQLMHLLPNGQGQLEGSLQVTTPLGCLEAQFEAITVDLMTQQESYKASLKRAVAPAGVTPLPMDDLEL